MGITIVQKSDLKKPRPRSRKALILAGGAVSGGSFKAGGVKALNDYLVEYSVNDFDIFVGISSGSMIATALMGGISPESVLKSLDGTSGHFTPLTALHYYRPNFSELVSRPLGFIAHLAGWLPGKLLALAERYPDWSHGLIGAAWRFLTYPSLSTYEEMMGPIVSAAGGGFPSLLGILPSGIFDNSPIEGYFRTNIERNGLTNDFREAHRLTGKRLYISAMRLDGARRVVFGSDEDTSLTISQAVQASTALPGFYKPARIDGVDYVDGGVQETADIDIAVEKGADLIVCYNPFRPYEAGEFVEGFSRSKVSGRRLAADGWMAVMNQIFRAVFHARLRVVLENFRESRSFNGDIILIEPRADDRAFFALNPLSLRNRIEAARMGFESVRNSIEQNYDEISRILSAHGIAISRSSVEKEFERLSDSKLSELDIQSLLEGRRLKLRKGRRARGVAKRLTRKKKGSGRKA
ncbi:MAG TPA: patatin-like phospholipase family protein [bacterium]|nr:patatin-like phospholipase family protein [bacterium]